MQSLVDEVKSLADKTNESDRVIIEAMKGVDERFATQSEGMASVLIRVSTQVVGVQVHAVDECVCQYGCMLQLLKALLTWMHNQSTLASRVSFVLSFPVRRRNKWTFCTTA